MNETILKVIASLQSNTSELRSILNFNENERHYIIQAMRDIQQAVDFLTQVGTPLKPDEQFLFGGGLMMIGRTAFTRTGASFSEYSQTQRGLLKNCLFNRWIIIRFLWEQGAHSTFP